MFGRPMSFGHHWGGPPHWRHMRARLYNHVLEALQNKPTSGYEVLQAIEEHTPPWFQPGAEMVYPLLQLQVDRGHATIQTEDGRTRYGITEAGRAFLAEQQAESEEHCGHGCGWRELPEDVRAELHQAKDQFRELAHSLKREGWKRGGSPERLRQALGIVNRALAEIRDLPAS